ncbi:MAG: Adenylate cyclase [uncultured Solirubrobacterales bacterium]|uniref:Adenylate cyclase n=1 Tax=uncultured Solirubrobacterales bacterium TaxID=768556 RepID=A0A6J4SEC9_9ACTN|nr:MAG: Adenylate cyclase [uncultured Solirubrobacterales bacterium]
MRRPSPDDLRESLAGLQSLANRARPSGGQSVDLEAEGLLEDLEGEETREARVELLEQLLDAGVGVEELKSAVAEERLTLLPVERVLSGDGEYTLAQVAERGGLDLDVLRRHLVALGLGRNDDEEQRYDDDDVEAARLIRQFYDAGLPEDGLFEVARVLGQGMARTAEAMRTMVAEAFIQPGDTERDLGLRYAEAVEQLSPMADPLLTYVLRLHLLELVRSDVVDRATLSSGRFPDATEVTVCFADLVGFTRLGEEITADELERVAKRLTEMASEQAAGPVRFVKTIGDAVMLVSPEPQPLLDAALNLVEQAGEKGERFPPLRAGVAIGQALSRGGDWYGRPVNLASRVAEIARTGSVVATGDVRKHLDEEARGRLEWSRAGRRRIKGIEKPVALFRVRRTAGDRDSAPDSEG